MLGATQRPLPWDALRWFVKGFWGLLNACKWRHLVYAAFLKRGYRLILVAHSCGYAATRTSYSRRLSGDPRGTRRLRDIPSGRASLEVTLGLRFPLNSLLWIRDPLEFNYQVHPPTKGGA